MFNIYYVPNFPVNKITNDGRDGWINMPNHPKNKCGFLEAILEHIDNTNHIDPIRIVIHSEKDIQAGPSGTSRLYALTHIKNYNHIPAIVSSTEYYKWFGENVVKIEEANQIKNYLLLEPVVCQIEQDGKAWWHNQNPNKDQMEKTFNVKKETINRLLNCV